MHEPSADRRLSTLVRHLLPSSPRTSTATSADALQAFPTMASSSSSVFAAVPQGPEDPILGVTVAFNKDPSPVKVNLGVGAYRTEEGKPLVLNVVKRAEAMLIHNESRVKEYLPITGLADFNKLSAKLIFGADSPAIQENRVVTVQALSGTGSLRVGGEFLARHYHELMTDRFEMSMMGELKFFLGFEIKKLRGGTFISQTKYIQDMLKKFDMIGVKEKRTPMDTKVHLQLNPKGIDVDQKVTTRESIRSTKHLIERSTLAKRRKVIIHYSLRRNTLEIARCAGQVRRLWQ